jgi:hypothetical protein
MPRYRRYIKVMPTLLRDRAQAINSADATRKKMYAANIGGLGEYHINIKDAIRLDIIPMISAMNLTGWLL